jgi:uncharacterized protein (DUF2235 family)
MPKNIVILLDGTSNEISADRTNILRLYGALEKSDRQIVYYDPGVGTFGDENSWLRTWRKALEIWGMATGWGLDQNVKEAYRFLIENYNNGKSHDGEAQARDRIYIFGFSRGAYSARVLAGFIHAVGLIRVHNLNLLDYAFRAYKAISDKEQDDTASVDADAETATVDNVQEEDKPTDGKKNNSFKEVRLYERMLKPDRPPIRLLGLFDTVASVIEHGRHGIRLRSHAFTESNKSVESVRHAVGIDELRSMFRPQLWPDGGEYWGNPFNRAASKPQDVREVWFAGVHCDVGGGYPEEESGLAKLPLKWMIEQTMPMGLYYNTRTINDIVLGINPKKTYVAPNAHAKPHNSMNWAWAFLEFVPRFRPKGSERRGIFNITVPLFERRAIPSGAHVHQSVLDRVHNGSLKPPNLPSDLSVET